MCSCAPKGDGHLLITRVEPDVFCPNCGWPVDVRVGDVNYYCPHCHESLKAISDRKIILANPLTTYLRRVDFTPRGIAAARASIPPPATAPEPSPQRKKRSYELARRRISEEKNQSVRGLVYGILFAVFGGLLLMFTLLRMFFVTDDWLNLVGLGFGVVMIPIGVYITAWFSVTLRVWNKDELDLEAESGRWSGE